MAQIGTLTRYVIGIGLAIFIVLLFIPGMRSYAVGATLVTPIVASIVSGIELMMHQKVKAGMAMLFAVALVVASLLFGVSQ